MKTKIPTVAAEEHLGLVHLCANRFRGRGIEYEELYSAGCLGLVKAANAFDPTRTVCFSTYAVPVIMGEMKKLFREGGSVRIGRRLHSLSVQAARICEELRQKNCREPSVREIAAEMGMTEAETAQAICACSPTVSLTALSEDGEIASDIPVPSHETALQEHLALEQVLDLLNPQDRRLIRLRYEQQKTQSQTADKLGMTQVQVSRREKRILAFLRNELLR